MKKTLLGLGGVHLILIVIAIGVVGGGAFFAKHNPKESTAGIYCSSEGMFTNKMPIQSHRSYCVKSDSEDKIYNVNTPNEYSFTVVDDQGNTLKNYAITHAKQMHVIVVRKDLAYFQHIHPEFNESTGTFTLSNLTFLAEGEYRIFADFSPKGGMMDSRGMSLAVTLSEDVKVGSTYNKQVIGSEEKSKTFAGMEVFLSTFPVTLQSGQESMLTFDLKQDNKTVTDLQEYLGAMGHSVILEEGTLNFIHAHPIETKDQNGKVQFMVTFPSAGKYKVFTQFQRSGKVITTDFVVAVAQGNGDQMIQGMDH